MNVTETDQRQDLWPAPRSCRTSGRCCAFWQTPVHPLTYELPPPQPVDKGFFIHTTLLEILFNMIYIGAVHNVTVASESAFG